MVTTAKCVNNIQPVCINMTSKCVKSTTRYMSLLHPSVGALGYVLCVNMTTKYVLSLQVRVNTVNKCVCDHHNDI